MSKEQFQRAYHDFAAPDVAAALAECRTVNAAAEGFAVHVVRFDHSYALMLDTAIASSLQMGIIAGRDVLIDESAPFSVALALELGARQAEPIR